MQYPEYQTMNGVTTEQLGVIERGLAMVDEMPGVFVYRGLVGYALGPLYQALVAEPRRSWSFVPFLLVALVALRIVPGLTRRLFPFSIALRELWLQRRLLARRYDSYQWRKLFGFGCGLAAWLVVSRSSALTPWTAAGICGAGGLAGLWCWQQHASAIRKVVTS
jgi:hypothetical protein